MRLAPIPYQSPDDREKLRPKVGDVVLFEGTKYIVDQVGLKYVDMSLHSDPRIKGFAPMSKVSKYFEPESDDTPPLSNLMREAPHPSA